MNLNFTSPYGASAVDPAAASSNWIKQFAANTAATANGAATPAASAVSDVGGLGGLAGGLQTAGSAMDILGGLAQIYFGFQQQKLAKKQFAFQREAFNTNLRNSVQSYNTALGDRIRARHFTEGKSDSETAAYLKENRLTTSGV